jgi:hypothetical protein
MFLENGLSVVEMQQIFHSTSIFFIIETFFKVKSFRMNASTLNKRSSGRMCTVQSKGSMEAER